MNKSCSLFRLTLDFVRYGCFTFGGGWSIVAQMQQKYVQEEGCITDEELMDIVSVSKSLPGTMIGNIALLYGYRTAGIPGGLAALFGMTTPPMLILIIISFFYNEFRSNYWVNALMGGMQAAVVPIIASAAVNLTKSSIRYSPCVVVALLCMLLYLFTGITAVWLVVIGLVSGLIIGEYYERKEAKKNGSA